MAGRRERGARQKALVALVTGANRGIGLDVCRQLACRGLRVILTARDLRKAEAAASALTALKLEVTPLALDVTDATSIRNAARTAGAVDVLVNNAAVLIAEHGLILTTPVDQWRDTYVTNVFGPLAVCQAFIPGMVDRGYGRVVNVSSAAGQLSSMGTYAPAYSTSKAALNALTVQLAAAVRNTGVLVNCANPGWVRTKMGGPHAPRSIEEGADTIVWLATLPANGPTGKFFSDRKQIEW